MDFYRSAKAFRLRLFRKTAASAGHLGSAWRATLKLMKAAQKAGSSPESAVSMRSVKSKISSFICYPNTALNCASTGPIGRSAGVSQILLR